MRYLRDLLRGMVVAATMLSIGVLAVPACLLLGLIIVVWGASEKILRRLDS